MDAVPACHISVIVPVLHEAAALAPLLARVNEGIQSCPGVAAECIVVDGAPQGDTIAALPQALPPAAPLVQNTTHADACTRHMSLAHVATPSAPTAGAAMAGADRSVADGLPTDVPSTAPAASLPLRVLGLLSAPGRARQMNAGAAIATGRVLLFLHADTQLPEGWPYMVLAATGNNTTCGTHRSLSALPSGKPARTCAAGGVLHHHHGCIGKAVRAGGFTLGIDAPGVAFRVIETLANLRNALTRTPYGDQAQFFDHALFHAVGGYPDLPLMEDVAIMLQLRKSGEKIAILPGRVLTSARRWEKEGLFRCSARNVLLRTLYACGVSAQTLARWYRPHKEQI